MGNRILEEKKNPGGKVVENNRYAYNDSNQLAEATLCNGRTTRKVCYTYDADGNLLKEYSPTDNGQTSYQYTVENRLEAVYTGNAYNRTLQMAAAYDGDGNRVYQVNYNPEKDEDFSCYYRTYNSCDYNGTGIQLKAAGEVSPTEEDLISLIAPRRSHPHQQVRTDRVRQRREPRVRGSPGRAEHQRPHRHHLHLRRRPDQQGALQPDKQNLLLPGRNIDFLRQCILLP